MANLQQRTPAWHVARRGKLTASNLGATLGLVSYTSRETAYRRALGTDKFEGNVATQYGTDNENNGVMDYQILSGNMVEATGLHVHKDNTWLAGSPDGFVGEEGMIEVKCPYYRRKDGSRLHKEVPHHYYLQMNALLEICDRAWCDYVCWSPSGMVVYRVYRDTLLFEYLLTYYSQFYAAMQAGADGPPPLKCKDEIEARIHESVTANVDYTHWTAARPHTRPPSSDPFDSMHADETRSPPPKRQCVSTA